MPVANACGSYCACSLPIAARNPKAPAKLMDKMAKVRTMNDSTRRARSARTFSMMLKKIRIWAAHPRPARAAFCSVRGARYSIVLDRARSFLRDFGRGVFAIPLQIAAA